jgi:hypothetical protein
VLGHNIGFGLFLALISFTFSTRRLAASCLVLLSFHLHLLGDLVGSKGPHGYQWPIPYLIPFSDAWQWIWAGQWQLNAWPRGRFFYCVWRLNPMLSHPRDPNYAGENKLANFDNGNTRCYENRDLCFSRWQVYIIDEENKIAYLSLNTDLGSYNPALGSAQGLLNGNFHFNAGVNLSTFPIQRYGISTEVLPDGTSSYQIRYGSTVYKSFRMRDLYSTPGD